MNKKTIWACACVLVSAMASAQPAFEKTQDLKDLPLLDLQLPEAWGQRIPEQDICRGTAERRSRSPEILVKGLPAQTTHMVVYFYNRSARPVDNHGLIQVALRKAEEVQRIPSVGNHSKTLPARVQMYEDGSQWGVAYVAPCPGTGAWEYRVTVYAMQDQTVVAKADTSLGWVNR